MIAGKPITRIIPDRKMPTATSSDATDRRRAVFLPFETKLGLSTDHRCFDCLGFSPLILNHFEAGYYPSGHGFLAQSLVIRLHDTHGNPLGYAGCRAASSACLAGQNWKKPRDLPRSRLIYNWHRAAIHDDQPLFITPNPWAVMKLFSAGFKNAVALFEPCLTRETARLINDSPAPGIYLLHGGSPPPDSTILKLQQVMGERARIVFLPRDIVVDAQADEDVEKILSPYCR